MNQNYFGGKRKFNLLNICKLNFLKQWFLEDNRNEKTLGSISSKLKCTFYMALGARTAI